MLTYNRPTIEFDHHSEYYSGNWRQIYAELHANNPIVWTEAHGGFWVIASYDEVRFASTDVGTFSSFNDVEGGPGAPKGILIPPNPYQLALNEQDPPASTMRRMVEAPLFTPRYMNSWQSLAEKHVSDALDAIIAKGGGDFMMDLALPVPAKTALNLVGVPTEEWADYALPAHKATQVAVTSQEYPLDQIMAAKARLVTLVQNRRSNPQSDMASRMAGAKIEGQPMDDDVAGGMLLTLATGGFDTATSLLCHSLIWLDEHREAWPHLRGPGLENAVDELLRYFPPNTGTARNVVKEVTLGGQVLRPGERVMVSWAGANYDPIKFENPNEMRLDRKNASEQLSFGAGPHRCLGSPLARIEIKRVLQNVIERIPNYRVRRDEVEYYSDIGAVNGVNKVPFDLV